MRFLNLFSNRLDDPEGRRIVIDLLKRWGTASERVDEAPDAMRLTVARNPSGMASDEFESARQHALNVLEQVIKETSTIGFWPSLTDASGASLAFQLSQELDLCHRHQMVQLSMFGQSAQAFRNGEPTPVTNQEIERSNRDFEKAIDGMGKTAAKLARRYGRG